MVDRHDKPPSTLAVPVEGRYLETECQQMQKPGPITGSVIATERQAQGQPRALPMALTQVYCLQQPLSLPVKLAWSFHLYDCEDQ